MKRLLPLIVALCFSCIAGAQNITLEADNRQPRVGQEIELEVSSNFLDNLLQKKLPAHLNLAEEKNGHDRKIVRKIVATHTGKMVVGPFKIRVNGKRYKTNSLTLDVQPALEPKEGFWVRLVNRDGEQMILLEQLMRTKEIRTSSSPNTYSISYETNDDDFLELVEGEKFDGVEFKPQGSGIGFIPNTLVKWPPTLRYSYKFYRIERSKDSPQEKIKLSPAHFRNWTEGFYLPEIIIP